MSEPPTSPPERAPMPVEPMPVDSRKIAFVGLAIFTVATIGLLPFWSWLGTHHHRVWLWTCVAGVGVGLFGFAVSSRHKRAGRTK